MVNLVLSGILSALCMAGVYKKAPSIQTTDMVLQVKIKAERYGRTEGHICAHFFLFFILNFQLSAVLLKFLF